MATPTATTDAPLPSGSAVKELAAQFAKFYGAQLLEIEDETAAGSILLTPAGVQIHSLKSFLDDFRAAPERREGTAELQELASFLEHVNRFKDPASAIFALPTPERPTLTAVLDYHREGDGAPRFGRHRSVYAPPLSEEWKAWQAKNAQSMAQLEFAEFIENRIGDVIVPPMDLGGDEGLQSFVALVGGGFMDPPKLLELSRGLAVSAQETVKQAVSLATGEISVQYEQVHGDGRGNALRIPNLFLIAIPVFRAGPLYRVPVRLRYRLGQGAVKWSVHLYRSDKVFDHAFRELATSAEQGTNLPVFIGAPEK